MVICGGSGSNPYYRCETRNKRKNCTNDLSVRESVVRESLLDEIRHRLASEEGVRYARKRIAEVLGKLARERGSRRREHRARLEKLEGQIAKVVDFIAEGTGGPSHALRERLRALEKDANVERRALSVAESSATTPMARVFFRWPQKWPRPNRAIARQGRTDRRCRTRGSRRPCITPNTWMLSSTTRK
jgi:hypothetical protein